MTTAKRHPSSERDRSARCPRCNGLMVADTYFGRLENCPMQRCTRCGEVIDPVILHNRRQLQSTGSGRRPRQPGGDTD